jgi:hypothetical protein
MPGGERRQLRGLRWPALPKLQGPLLAQLGGGAALLAGVWTVWGVGVALMVAGAASVVLGALREAGKV